jgi:hypothetical protein
MTKVYAGWSRSLPQSYPFTLAGVSIGSSRSLPDARKRGIGNRPPFSRPFAFHQWQVGTIMLTHEGCTGK